MTMSPLMRLMLLLKIFIMHLAMPQTEKSLHMLHTVLKTAIHARNTHQREDMTATA